MSGNHFSTLYKTWTTDKLLDIVDNPADYQPLAVEAAKGEIDSRQLSQEQLAGAKAEQNLRRLEKADNHKKVKDFQGMFKSVASSLGDVFRPVQNGSPANDKIVKLISFFIAAMFFYHLYEEFGMLRFMFTYDSGGKWDFSTVLYFFPFIILPVAGLLFWFRKKMGWILATIYFTYTTAGAIQLFMMQLNRKPTGVPALDGLFPAISPAVYIGTFLVFGGLTWTLCKENIRAVYGVDKKSMFIALGIGTGIILLAPALF